MTAPSRPPPAALDAEPSGAPLRVLAAEDNRMNQAVLQAALEALGARIVIAPDGRCAVQAWREGAYDLVLMDIRMPVMDGVEAVQAIRAAERAEGRPRTPVLALSGDVRPGQVLDYMAAGMDGHVAKPIDLGLLQQALDRIRCDREARLAA